MSHAASLLAVLVLLAGATSTARAALPPEKVAQLPAPARERVDFVRDIQPIFEASCVQCHARGKNKGDFSLETRRDFLEGGETGVAAVAGKSAESLVIEMISGLTPDNVMPQKGKKLTPAQVSLFRAWIDQGMPWPQEITFFKHEPANLRARGLTPPPAKAGLDHPVDRLVDAYFTQKNGRWAAPVDDRMFARRVWLDVVGLLPPPAALEAFVADRAPDRSDARRRARRGARRRSLRVILPAHPPDLAAVLRARR